MSKLTILKNPGLIEIERSIVNLYAKRLISKDDLKDVINNLKFLVERLPEHDEIYLH